MYIRSNQYHHHNHTNLLRHYRAKIITIMVQDTKIKTKLATYQF